MTRDDKHESSIYFIWKIGHCDPSQIQQSHQKVWTDQIHIYGSHQKAFQKVKMFKQHCQTKPSYIALLSVNPGRPFLDLPHMLVRGQALALYMGA